MKTCSCCKESKTLDNFRKCQKNKDGLAYCCNKCVYDKTTKYRREHPELYRKAMRKKDLQKRYNMTLEQFADMKTQQQNKCKICGRAEFETARPIELGIDANYRPKIRNLNVDHNHTDDKHTTRNAKSDNS